MFRSLRNHWHFLVVVPALIVVMTYPTIRYVFDREVFWLPTTVYDVWTNIWNAWYFELLLAGKAELLFTNLMFYPDGVSLAFQSFSLPHVLMLGVLNAILPLSSAYNLTYLLTIFITTLSAYFYLLYLLRLKWICLFGAIVFGCSIYVIGRPSQPLVTTIATIPLALYFFQRAVLEQRWLFAAISGLIIGFTAFIGIYTYVCLVMLLGLVILYFVARRWRQSGFWLCVILALAIAASIGLARVYPMWADSPALEEALQKWDGREFDTDLVHNFANFEHPVTAPLFIELFGRESKSRWNSTYLGYVPLALIAIGLFRPIYRRKMLFWLYLMLPFLVLRLGSALTIRGHNYNHIFLPKHILDELFPFIFEAIYSPAYFHSAALLPLAVMACYGAMSFLRLFSHRLRWPIIVLLIGAVAFEYYYPLDHMVIPKQQLAFLDWLAEEDNQEEIRLINVPMGRVNSKLYDFYQTLSAYPHAEGLAGRTPPIAYDYINSNPLLSAWSKDQSMRCQPSNQAKYLAALNSLAQDGFTYVLMHDNAFFASKVEDSFLFAVPAFQNEYAAVYRLSDLSKSCPSQMPGHEAALHLSEFFNLADQVPRRNESILSLHPGQPLTAELHRFYSAEAARWKSLIHVSLDSQGEALVQSSDSRSASLADIVKRNGIVWLVYNPQATDLRSNGIFNEWFSQAYRACGGEQSGLQMRLERYIRREFPCKLVEAPAALSVRYDNGIQLANRFYDIVEQELQVLLWWSDARSGDHAYSIQIFDDDGVKIAQDSDSVLRYDPLILRRIDISQLRPGAYSARLILYHADSKISQPGTVMQNQSGFDRELEISRFLVEN